MERIIQTENEVQGELYVELIFGTNIFTVNRVKRPKDLEVEFLRILSRLSKLSAHTGMLLDFADDPDELFGKHGTKPLYEKVNVGISRGSFYDRRDWPHFHPCFFPRVDGAFWDLEKPEIGFTWRDVLYYDAIAFYVAPSNPDYLVKMNSLFHRGFVSSEEWIKESLRIYRLIVTSVGDMNYFKVYAADPDNFDLLTEAIEETENIARNDPWFQENKNDLVWDAERSLSLKLRI